jgi:hypothetical protein
VVSANNTQTAPNEHALTIVPPGQPQSVSQPQPQASSGPSTNPSPAADQTEVTRARREALQQQLQHLQTDMAQTSQSVSSLHNQANEERHDLDALQRQRAAQQAQVNGVDAGRDHAPVQATQPSQTRAPNPEPEQAATGAPAPTPAPPQIAQAAEPSAASEPSAPLPLPPPLPSNPPPNVAAPPSPQIIARAGATNAARFAAADNQEGRSQRAVQSNPGALQATLDRLRQAPPDAAPQAAPPNPDIAARGAKWSSARGPDTAYGQPRQLGPHARLEMARAALVAGRIEEARQYLEEAQLQLVFRPVTPTGDEAPGGSRVAGDVASALSMLGAGNIGGALGYVDRAMEQARSGGYPPPPGYSYGGPYGGAPVAQAGQ